MTNFTHFTTLPADTFETATSLLDSKRFAEGENFVVTNKITSIGLSSNGCWFAKTADGGSVTSYEKVGFHKGSVAFFRGMRYALPADSVAIAYDHSGNPTKLGRVYDQAVQDAQSA